MPDGIGRSNARRSRLGPGGALRALLVERVRAVFNDAARGETPVVRSDQALYPPGSVIWRVHGDVATMMIGGVAALLMQMLHPAVLAGVWDHSVFRADMLGRLRRTARFIAVTTFGERTLAEAAIARVRGAHLAVRGILPDGTAYSASDPHLLAWVHVCEAVCFLAAWNAYGDRRLSLAEQDAYFAEAGLVARALGADPVPQTRAEADALIAALRSELVVDARTRDVARMVLRQPAQSLSLAPALALIMRAAVGVLPEWAIAMHGLTPSPLARPVVRLGAFTVAESMRWAFRGG